MDFLFAGFASAFWSSATLGDGMIFAISTTAFGVLVALTVALGVGVAWVANRPMPKPSPGLWRLADVAWKASPAVRGKHR